MITLQTIISFDLHGNRKIPTVVQENYLASIMLVTKHLSCKNFESKFKTYFEFSIKILLSKAKDL